jgi:hypothetical protein
MYDESTEPRADVGRFLAAQLTEHPVRTVVVVGAVGAALAFGMRTRIVTSLLRRGASIVLAMAVRQMAQAGFDRLNTPRHFDS